MGYETRLIIGQIYRENDPEGIYMGVIATIDLCKSCFYDTFIDDRDKDQKAFFYNPNSDVKVTEDCYGSELLAIDPAKVLKMMRDDNKNNEYRRYNAAIPMLASLIKDFPKGNLKCILFGH